MTWESLLSVSQLLVPFSDLQFAVTLDITNMNAKHSIMPIEAFPLRYEKVLFTDMLQAELPEEQ